MVFYIEFENYSINKERVTLTGHSYGGFWALYALFHSDTIAKNTFSSMKAHTYRGLSMDYEVIEDYDHNTVFKPSIRSMMLRCYGTDQ